MIDLPALDAGVMYKIDRFGLSFWSAIHNADGEWSLPPMARRRVQRWYEEAVRGLGPVEYLL